ncbi:unnamed protein product [Phyllotreta striolata]|uniref:Methyltransferase domain-containing protein n=1 Tax=Phyllotreta striolata TaxID=444603 RepID=A0A9P0GXG9_PHYSR|nr:unnamed protein product [Phyllotreta striolata]
MNRPQLYAKFSDLQKTDNSFVLDNYLETGGWGDGESICDIGCGDGTFSVEGLAPRLPDNFERLIACDVSEKMLDFARDKYPLPKFEFVEFDVSADDVPDEFRNAFHHVFSFYTMHWVRRQRKAFKNVFKMLKPGGDILFTFLAKSSLYDIYQNMSKRKKWSQYSVKEYISPYHGLKQPEKHLQKLLNNVGFDVKVCKLVTRSFHFPTLDVFRNTITAVNPIVQKLHPDDVEEYQEDFMAELSSIKSVVVENVNNNSDKSIREIHKIFVVIAKKPE